VDAGGTPTASPKYIRPDFALPVRRVRGSAFGVRCIRRIAFGDTVKSSPLSFANGVADLAAFYLAYQQFCRVNKIV
jgi:hypothetical protein